MRPGMQAQAEGHCGLWRGMPASSWRKEQGVHRWQASHPQAAVTPTKKLAWSRLGCWAAGLPTGWASSANEKQAPHVEERKKWGPKMPARRQAEFNEYQAVSLGWWQVIQKRQNIKLKKGKLKTINYQKLQCELKNKNTKARGRDSQRTSGRTYRKTVGEVNTAGENETQETTERTRLDKYGLFERLVGRKSPLSEQNMAAQLRKIV